VKKNISNISMQLHFQMLASVLEFMGRSGVEESLIRDAVDKGIARFQNLKTNGMRSQQDDLRMGGENISAQLLRIWHRDGRYIDRDAKPRPLFLSKGRNSLRKIVKRLDPSTDAMGILREMRSVGLIRKVSSGKYLPTSESAIVGQLHPLAVEHVAKLVIRLVSTVGRNLDPTGNALPLIERHAYAPNLNAADSAAFAEFTRAQGMAYLESVDDWLEHHKVREATSEDSIGATAVAASVHLFAYLGDSLTDASRIGSSASKNISRSTGSKNKSTKLTPSRATPAAISSPR
jgi:hypothetical protein